MTSSDKAAVVMFTVLFSTIALVLCLWDLNASFEMKNCVQSGKQWVHKDGHYNCIDSEKK